MCLPFSLLSFFAAHLNRPFKNKFTCDNSAVFLLLLFCLKGQGVAAEQLSCLLEPSQTISLSSSVTGVVKAVHVDRGDAIKKGQVLFTLDNATEKASLETYRVRMEFAQHKLARNEKMFADQLLSDFAYDEAITEHTLARLAMNEAQVKLDKRAVRSPIDGQVVRRDIEPGEYVGEAPVMQLVALDSIYAEAVLRAQYYGKISEGMEVDLQVLAAPQSSHRAKVVRIDPVIDGASGTFGVRLALDNRQRKITAGLKCQVDFAL